MADSGKRTIFINYEMCKTLLSKSSTMKKQKNPTNSMIESWVRIVIVLILVTKCFNSKLQPHNIDVS